MTNQLRGFRGDHGPYIAWTSKIRWIGPEPHFPTGTWHVNIKAEPEQISLATTNQGDDHDDYTRLKAEFNAKLFAKSYELALFVQKIITEFAQGSLITEEPVHAVALRDEARSLLSDIIGSEG